MKEELASQKDGCKPLFIENFCNLMELLQGRYFDSKLIEFGYCTAVLVRS